MALPPLHDRFALFALYVGYLLRFGAGAIVLLAVAVVAHRQFGMGPGEVRQLMPGYVAFGAAVTAALALVATWRSKRRRVRRRRY